MLFTVTLLYLLVLVWSDFVNPCNFERWDMPHFLDITKDKCPMTMVKVKFALSKLKLGQQLEVLLCNDEPLKNIPRTAKDQGHKIIEIKKVNESFHKIIIEK